MNNNTAILLFSRNPFEDAKLKSSGGLLAETVKCFDESLMHIFNVIHNSGLNYFVSTTSEKGEEYFSKLRCNLIIQSGNSFGERIHYSIKKVFENGYENVIVIGNDTPSLKLKDIKFTAKNTAINKSVIGPSKDGGFYLFSINRNDFYNIETLKFININYQQSNTLSSLICLLNDYSIYQHFLKKKDDFDKIFQTKDYILFKNQLEKVISQTQNIIFYILYLNYLLALFIRYKNSFYTFTSLSSPPILI